MSNRTRLLWALACCGLALTSSATPIQALTEEVLLSGLSTPTFFSLAIDSGGMLYTLDNRPPNAVRRVTPSGCEIVLTGGAPLLDRGRGLAVGPNGDVYASASASHNLVRIQPNGTVLELMNNEQFVALTGVLGNWLPLAIAIDATGEHLYVTESASPYVVRIATATGAATIAYPRPETLTRPADPRITARGATVDPMGNLYLACGLESALIDRVIRVPADGGPAVVVLQDDPTGLRVQEPYSVRFGDAGNLYVAGFKSNNVLKVTPGGTVTQVIGPEDGLLGPRDVAIAADGTVFAASGETPVVPPVATSYGVYRVPPGGPVERIDDDTNSATLERPKSLALDHHGNLYLTGELSGTLVRITLQPGTCGNGLVDGPAESCDYKVVGETNCCCTADCTFQVPGALCGSDTNECTDDVCRANGVCVHENRIGPCTSDNLFCTGPEVCGQGECIHEGDPCLSGDECGNVCQETGEGNGTCFSPVDTLCAEDSNPCTETRCDGSGHCNAYAANVGTVCRAAAGNCDVADRCTGLSPNCPPDQVVPTTVCRASAGECDLVELCDSESPLCPADLKVEAGTLCSGGTCNAAGICQRGGDGGGTCGDGTLDEGEECDLGTPRNGAGENGESCCTAGCLLQSSSFVCRYRDSVCQKDRTCANSLGECAAGFPSDADDQICSPTGTDTVDGCTLFRCHDGQCAEPICSVDVQPISADGDRLPRAFDVTCRRAGLAEVGACSAVGFLDARTIVTGPTGRATSSSCAKLAAAFGTLCGAQDPLYPYCRLVEKKLGSDGILTGRCKRIVDRRPNAKRCAAWLRKLGQPQCSAAARDGFSPLFRIQTTLSDIVSPKDQIAATTVVTLCDRTRCVDAP